MNLDKAAREPKRDTVNKRAAFTRTDFLFPSGFFVERRPSSDLVNFDFHIVVLTFAVGKVVGP